MAFSGGAGKRVAWLAACLALALVFAAPDARTAGAADPAMAALGDSLTRGWGAGGSGGDLVSASWSTGSDPAVSSHFQRLSPLEPGLTATNAAVSGSKMAATATQADAAVAAGAMYVTLLSGTNDVCTATVAAMTSVANFTNQARATLTELAAIPDTQILVASIPDWHALWSDHNSNPTALAAWSSNNVCPTIFGSDTSNPDRNAARQRITDFNAALASVCAEFAECTSDGGAAHALRFETTDLAFDFFHFSVPGQAMLAEATWEAGPFSQPPVNQSPPVISGTAQVGQTLSASTGTWSGSPSSFAYQWRRCNAGGTGCADLSGATSSTYQPVAADVDSTLRVRVTATNTAGSSSAESAPSALVTDAPGGGVPPGFASVVTDSGCGGCSVSAITDGLQASIAGAADSSDTAYGVQELGGAGGLTGRVFSRTLLSLAPGQTLAGNLSVLQVRSASGQLVYELYLASDRSLRLWSPAGGLRGSSINLSTGIVLPNDGSSRRVEVSALVNGSVIVRVEGVDRITLGGLSGGTSSNQRFLRAGIDHYDGSSGQPVTVQHTHVATSQVDWLGAPG